MFKRFSHFRDSTNDRQSVRLPSRRDEAETAIPILERNTPLPEYNTRSGNYRNVATTDAQSLQSLDIHAPPPTSPKDNKKLTIKYLTLVISIMYVIILFCLGIMIYFGQAFVGTMPSHIFSICLIVMGFVYITFLIFDIHKYKSLALKNRNIKSEYDEKFAEYFRLQQEEHTTNNETTPISQTPEMNFYGNQELPPVIFPPVLIPLKHQYCFSFGRHSGSFYLKLGVAGFAMGHLVHSVLLIAVQVGFIVDDNFNNAECLDILQIVLDVMIPCYCFLQLYFIFKYSNVIILRAQGLARFAFMHMIASNLCFWVLAISRETTLRIKIYAMSVYGNGEYENNATKKVEMDEYDAEKLNETKVDISTFYNENCIGSKAVNTIVENLSPYLYPFSVEFNILTVAIYYMIWSNIGNCHAEVNNSDQNFCDDHTVCQVPTANEENDFTSNVVIHADCHASNRGLFAGIMLTVIVMGILILGFVFGNAEEGFIEAGYLLNDCMKLGLHSVMLVAAVFAFNQLRKLDINEHPMSLLDHVLLIVCLPAFFLETALSMFATVNILNVVKSIDVIIMMIQVIIQTPLIMDGLRRCSNSNRLRRAKPGRELIMFLLIANVCMWLFNTFSYKSPQSLDERYEFYGKVLWTQLGHVSLPLIMFYRFHSSVCFADIWDSAYKPGSEH